jgi:plasmid stabilization system protein ParE
MVNKQPVKIPENKTVKLTIQALFWETLQDVLDFSLNEWGAVVMYEFLKEINKSILHLHSMPDLYPKNQYLTSTENKIYRNIILKKYPYIIIYSVINKYNVKVLNIIHSGRNPKNFKKLI